MGATHPAFDAALDALGVASWGFISAANPMSQAVDPHVNHAQHDALIQAAQRMGYPVFPGLGIPENDAWDPEPSLCVCNISAPALQKLGIQFRQNAAVWGAVAGSLNLFGVSSSRLMGVLRDTFTAMNDYRPIIIAIYIGFAVIEAIRGFISAGRNHPKRPLD